MNEEERKMNSEIKMYLDTNMIIDLFTNSAKSMKDGKELTIPSKFRFLSENIEKFDFATSFLTKAEVMRELVSGYEMPENRVNSVWEDFVQTLRCKMIEEYTFDMKLVSIVPHFKMKLRTMINFMHLYIAITEGAYIVTGDKDLIKKARTSHAYDKIYSYPELQEAVSKLS